MAVAVFQNFGFLTPQITFFFENDPRNPKYSKFLKKL